MFRLNPAHKHRKYFYYRRLQRPIIDVLGVAAEIGRWQYVSGLKVAMEYLRGRSSPIYGHVTAEHEYRQARCRPG